MMKKIMDERVQQLNHKIQSEAYLLVLFLAAASIFVKSYILDLAVSEFAVELGIIILSTIYIAVRGAFLGYNFMDCSKHKKLWKILSVVVLSLAVSIMNGFRNYALYGHKYTGVFDGHFLLVLTVTFVVSLIFISVVFALLSGLNWAGQQRIERKLNQEDQDSLSNKY